MQLGAEVSLIVSKGLQFPVDGSQKRIVLSFEPLANLGWSNIKPNDIIEPIYHKKLEVKNKVYI